MGGELTRLFVGISQNDTPRSRLAASWRLRTAAGSAFATALRTDRRSWPDMQSTVAGRNPAGLAG
jgi:arginine repressor